MINIGLDFLAATAAPESENYNLHGWAVYTDLLDSGDRYAWAISRKHRDHSAPLVEKLLGRVFTRVLQSDSMMAELVIRDIHELSEHVLTAEATK